MLPLAQLEGLLLGTAVGDALGLPFEGLSRHRLASIPHSPLRHRWLLGRGMISDDTEHAALTLHALAAAGHDPDAFSRHLARGLRWWFAALPPAIGWATLRACLKLWLGWPPSRSGVRSAGNGALIRAVVIGAVTPDRMLRARLVEASTRITHTDPRALAAAHDLADIATDAATATAAAHPRHRIPLHPFPPPELATGVSGYAPHTLIAVRWVWSHHQHDPRRALEQMVALGGDTDSTAAIIGALAGLRHGAAAFPRPWLTQIRDAPRSLSWLRRAARAATDRGARWPRVLFPLALLRNLLFGLIAVAHTLRRWAPPYR